MSGGEVQTSEIFAGEHCRMCNKMILVICGTDILNPSTRADK